MRFENKYYLLNEYEQSLNAFCREHGALDENCFEEKGYVIETIYKTNWKTIDTRGKIRLRKYSTFNKRFYFIEEKIKSKGIGTKKRVEIDEGLFSELAECNSMNDFIRILTNNNIYLSNIPSELYTYRLKYFRIPWEIQYNGNKYRITIDNDLKVIVKGEDFYPIKDGYSIVEIKGNELKKNEAIDLLRRLEEEYFLKPVKLSKHNLAKKCSNKEYIAY
ncbi:MULTISPECIES: VTC domain-containing protein [Bacillus cereus group]|uniref:VTC domain-containing protein n=1 Tax=Bacillus thuringiensis serovar mexicanensis TaxID=180868 RepID=A0A2C9YEU7_BACTU|nr:MULTISPECIES: VTC domain-containing protein [Bacillus cereus group]EEM56765.1 hypothetical protein bthur0007_53990 [Bacillus thuringiensis serovar monterrey BGSC 4AJ1]MEB9674041.1 VTC domain-containing protein [Bacillus anthracis]OTW52672.1 hypothetical protein BK699_05865 [Bacillus thuringiensis serovar mexicanensis]OTX09978.1 hypothetical protein BK705_03740 [Bacillus thuringiensis serovar monterrey]